MFDSRKRLVVAVGVLTIGALGFAAPAAHAATTGSTDVTFTLSAGALTISVPSPTSPVSFSLASSLTSPGDYVGSAQLGSTTVTDTRGVLASSDTVTATALDFIGTTAVPSTNTTVYSNNGTDAVPASDGSLSAGTVTFSGGMVAVTGTPLAGTNLSGTGQQVMLGTTAGSGSASYNPTLTITVPQAGAIADVYSGAVTQSAS